MGAVAVGLVTVAGCGAGSSDEPPQARSGPSDELPEERMADVYLVADQPQQWVDWGSHVVGAEISDEREIEVSYLLSNGQQGREVDLAVAQVLWSHPEAVTSVAADQTVTLDVSPGWISGSPVVYEGDTRMEVGDAYLLTLADHYADGEQQLTRLFGSVSQADQSAVAAAEQQLSGMVADPGRAPRTGEAWDARFMRTRGYE